MVRSNRPLKYRSHSKYLSGTFHRTVKPFPHKSPLNKKISIVYKRAFFSPKTDVVNTFLQ